MNKDINCRVPKGQSSKRRSGKRIGRRCRKKRKQVSCPELPQRPFVEVAVSRTHHLLIGGSSIKRTLTLLKQVHLRHHVSAFLRGGVDVAVFIDPFSAVDRKNWKVIQKSCAGRRTQTCI